MEWRRVDLHLHTPASKDYAEPGTPYLDLLRRAEAQGLDIIAFTDHNTVAGYAAMRQEISDLARWEASGRLTPEEKQRLEEYRRLTAKILVLPGMELTATFGFHILAVFDPATPVRTLEHVLLELQVPDEMLDVGATEVGATSDVLTAYQVMDEAGALVIAAHANSSHGVAMFGFDFGGQTRIAYTQDPHLHAVEVTDLETTKRRSTASFFSGSKPEYPRRMHCIQGSDAHRLVGKGKDLGIGDRVTEVSLSEVSFKALKELFLSNDFARTRPYRRSAEPFDEVEAARQQGPTIVQSFHENYTRRGGCLHRILCDVVGFANTNGGTIYVGAAAQPRVPPKGVENPEASLAELRGEIERQVTPPIDAKLSLVKSHDKALMRVIVPKGEDAPYVLEGSYIYVRQETESSLAVRDEIVRLVTRAHLPVMGQMAQTQSESVPQGAASQATPMASQMEDDRDEDEDEIEQDETPLAAVFVREDERTTANEGRSLPSEMAAVDAAGGSDAPRTGVEIIATEVRKGVRYHTMRDLRDGHEVHDVTHASARRLWRYAIALREKNAFQEDKVTWTEEYGLWHKYLRSGRPHYDLAQRLPDGNIRVYYGVSEDGIHGPWRQVVGMKD